MTDEDYRGTPPEGDEWRAFWKMKSQWDETREMIDGLSSIVRGAVAVRKLAPYIVMFAVLALAAVNKDIVLQVLQASLGAKP